MVCEITYLSMSTDRWDEVDERGEYQQAVEAIQGMALCDVQFPDIIQAFRQFGIHYVASDTRKLPSHMDNSATLIYTCRDPDCPSYMRFTISHNVVSRVSTDWTHNHEIGFPRAVSKTCSVCQKAGHNSRTCPIAKGASRITRLLAQHDHVALIGLLKQTKTDGYCLLQMTPNQMVSLVALIDLNDTEFVRKWFFFAPNNAVGVMGKFRLYARIFRWNNGRKPKLHSDMDLLTRSKQSYECRANMVNALTWYAHYAVLVEGEPPEAFCQMADMFESLCQLRSSSGYDMTCQLLKSALTEGALILQESHNTVRYITDGVLEVNRENVFSAVQSLVPNFMETISVRGSIGEGCDGMLSGAWTVRTIFVDHYELTRTDGPFSRLLSTATIVYRSSDG